jgi:hypothetical protein
MPRGRTREQAGYTSAYINEGVMNHLNAVEFERPHFDQTKNHHLNVGEQEHYTFSQGKPNTFRGINFSAASGSDSLIKSN